MRKLLLRGRALCTHTHKDTDIWALDQRWAFTECARAGERGYGA